MTQLCASLSADGQRAIFGGKDGYLHAWNAKRGFEEKSLGKLPGWVTCVAGSIDLRIVAIGCGDSIQVWDMETKTKLQELRTVARTICSLAISGDGRHLFAGSTDWKAWYWNLDEEMEPTACVSHFDTVTSVHCNIHGDKLVTGSSDGSVGLWSKAAIEMVRKHSAPVTCVRISSDGKNALSADKLGNVALWRVDQPVVLSRWKQPGPIASLAFESNGRRVVFIGEDSSVTFNRVQL